MNAKKTNPALDEKSKVIKKAKPSVKKQFPVKFDREGFFLAWGIGIVVAGVGTADGIENNHSILHRQVQELSCLNKLSHGFNGDSS